MGLVSSPRNGLISFLHARYNLCRSFCRFIADVFVLGVSSQRVDEGANMVHTVTLSRPTTEVTTFNLTLVGATANLPADFTAAMTFNNGVTFAAGVVTIPVGVTTFTVTYPTLTDALVELTETTLLTVGSASGVGSISDVVVPPADITVLSVSAAAANEGADLVHTVVLSGPTIAVTPFSFALADNTATDGLDYLGLPLNVIFNNGVTYATGPSRVIIPIGVTSFTVTYPTLADGDLETPETTILNVGGIFNNGTISDGGAPSLFVSPANADEGLDLQFNVVLNAATTFATNYFFSLVAGTATLTADYLDTIGFTMGVTLGVGGGYLTVPAGVNSFFVLVPTVTDAVLDDGETVTLTVRTSSVTGTINDVPLG